MMVQRTGRIAVGMVCLALGFATAARADSVVREEKTYTVSGTPDVSLRTFDGAIQVRSGTDPNVHVVIERHATSDAEARALQVDAEQSGNRITIEVKRPRGFSLHWFGESPHANLIVTVPRTTNLTAASGDGSVDAQNVSGRISLHSGDGAVTGAGLKGDIEVDTGDGSVRLEGLDGTLQGRSGDGSIHAAGRLAAVNLRTGDGSIGLVLGQGSTMSGDWSIATGDGSIKVDLPASFDADVDAHSGDGSVSVEGGLKLTVTGTLGSSRHELRGTLGKGGHLLSLRSGDGSIVLR